MNCFNIIAGACSILSLIITIFTIIPKMKKILLQIQSNNFFNFNIVGHSKIMMQKSINIKIYNIIKKYFGEEPEIYYDDGIFYVGWGWFIKETIIMKIEKHLLRYKYAVWVKKGTENEKELYGYSYLKILNKKNLDSDLILKERINWAKNI